jgi:hypothetical protein
LISQLSGYVIPAKAGIQPIKTSRVADKINSVCCAVIMFNPLDTGLTEGQPVLSEAEGPV